MKSVKVDEYVFFDESGTGGDNLYLGLGLIICKKPAELHEEFDRIRKKANYNNEIKFEKISRKRYAIYSEFIKAFKQDRDARFKAVVINKRKAHIKHFRYQRWVRFNTMADDLINSAVRKNKKVKIFADEKTSPAEDNFSDYLLTHVVGAKEVVIVNSKDYDLIQLCDLLLGGVRADFEGIIKSKLKKKIVKKVLELPKEKLEFYEYIIENGQPSETESGRVS